MRRSEMFDMLAKKVCYVCEVSLDEIINGCKSQNVVDARMLLVQYLRRIGMSNDDIAVIFLRKQVKDETLVIPQQIIKNKAKGIDKLFSGYSNRCMQSYAFGLMSIEIRDFCHEAYEGFYQLGMKQLPNK